MQNNVYIPFTVNSLTIQNQLNLTVPSGNREYIIAQFTFAPNWDGLNKIAVFSKDGVETVNIPIVDDSCQVPNEFMEKIGTIEVSVFAGNRRTVNIATLNVIQSGFKEGYPPLPPEHNFVYVQSPNGSITQIREYYGYFQYHASGEWKTIQGGDGSSNGWTPILSLIDDGERNVLQIVDWVGGMGTKPDTGYLGTDGIVSDISQATDIRGQQGIRGIDGIDGQDGQDGQDGEQGIQGEHGLDGKNAFEFATQAGYIGTEQDFYNDLASLNNLTLTILSITGGALENITENILNITGGDI